MDEKRKKPISLFRCCKNAIYKAIHTPRKLSLIMWCYNLNQPDYPNELVIACNGDFIYKLQTSLFEDKYRLKWLIDYLPGAIVKRLGINYHPYELLLNDWRKELLRWFNDKNFDISDKLLNILATQSIITYSYLIRIMFTNVEKGKNRCIIAFENLTYGEEREIVE